MSEIPPGEIAKPTSECYYLPHHPVFKADSSTTKIRVVFDGTSKGKTKIALNENLLIGPPVQRDLFAVCLRFRRHKYTMCGDVEKMFRQILVAPKHRDFQRIVWRESALEPLRHYRLNTVTYGTSCAPYLSVRTLQQLAYDVMETQPKVAAIILNDFYVDDLMTGAGTIDELVQLQSEIVNVLESAGFHLRKWSTNCWPLLTSLPDEQRELSPKEFEEDSSMKILGLKWHPAHDIYSFKVALSNIAVCTKRKLLSEISRVFDPMGLLTPVTVNMKILFKDLWTHEDKPQWDDEVPSDIMSKWNNFKSELQLIDKLEIPRYIGYNHSSLELHCYCDASMKAYCTVVYARWNEVDHYHTNIVAAKSKVSPVNVVSLPRLELLGALLLCRLVKKIRESFKNPHLKIYAYTDSQIVLHWLASPPSRWSVFISNRTFENISTVPRSQWFHFPSSLNPADCGSRGIVVSLHNSSDEHVLESLFGKVSSWFKLLRIVAYCLRFKRLLQSLTNTHHESYLSTKELMHARIVVLKNVQFTSFKQEIHDLQHKKPLASNNKMLCLSPLIGHNGLLRVGGRLRHSSMTFDKKYPVILPKNHTISKLIITHVHRKYLHIGASELFALLKEEFWILGSRNMIRRIIHECIQCFRQRNSSHSQIMGDLPKERVTQSRAFHNVGCDYAGPVMIRTSRLRKAPQLKAYIVLFVCMSTKALYLELASDLTTAAYLASLDRFVSRRGKPATIFSDNATNFKGSERVLNELHQLLLSQHHKQLVAYHIAKEGISWKFIPPSAPHFGGLWEAGVKSVKTLMKRVIGDCILTYEELYTFLTRVEGILNSRPLFAMPDNTLDPLTTAHFLISQTFTAVSDPSVLNENVSLLSRWEHIRYMAQVFWKRWHVEYLSTLQQRPKWRQPQTNLQCGDVILKEPNLPPAKWLLAKVIKIHPGQDNKVRVVTLKTTQGEFVRPITKIVPLPFAERT